jgi:predicted PurR-regulated permease PerM
MPERKPASTRSSKPDDTTTPSTPAATSALPQSRRLLVDLGHPFMWGFTATVGALVAFALGSSIATLSTVLVSIGAALFIALALEPVVHWLGARRMSRSMSIAVVFTGLLVVFGAIIAIVAPVAVAQIAEFAKAVPTYVTDVQNTEWFKALVAATGQGDLYQLVLDRVRTWLSNPANLLAVGGGALAVGTGLVEFISTSLIVLVLTLYFLASMPTMKNALKKLAPAYARDQLHEVIEQITEAVGGYVSGMAILAAINAVFAFILLTILGAPFAALLAFLALFITMIPMVGPVISWLLITVVTVFSAPWSALIFAIVYFTYMQVEAYLLTPRVMNKAVDIPGSLVLIGALVGGTLLGLLGALVAVPVTASLLLIVKDFYIPKQDAKLVHDD